jgi:hypothetical protein
MTTETKIVTPEFTASYLHVFEKQQFEGQTEDEARYSVQMVFPEGADLTAMKDAANAAVIDKFGADKKKWPKKMQVPFRDGNEEKDGEGIYKDATYLNCRSKRQPGIVDETVQPVLNREDFYSGCIARAQVQAFAYSHSGNHGVAFSLLNIQKVKDGDPLGGSPDKAEDVFAAYAQPSSSGAGASDNLF